MTRKSKKGIVGKGTHAGEPGNEIGPGLDFVKDELKFGKDIDNAVKDAKHKQGL